MRGGLWEDICVAEGTSGLKTEAEPGWFISCRNGETFRLAVAGSSEGPEQMRRGAQTKGTRFPG